MKKLDYLYIRAWGRMMGSFDYYIEHQVAEARADGAPQTAIYKDTDGSWHTYENCHSATKAQVDRILYQFFNMSN